MDRIKIPTAEFPEAHVVYMQKHGGPEMKSVYQFWIKRDDKASKFPWTHPAAGVHFPDGIGQETIQEVEEAAKQKLSSETEKWRQFLKTNDGMERVSKLTQEYSDYNPNL